MGVQRDLQKGVGLPDRLAPAYQCDILMHLRLIGPLKCTRYSNMEKDTTPGNLQNRSQADGGNEMKVTNMNQEK